MEGNELRSSRKVRIITSTCIMVLIAAIHAFWLGSYLSGDLYIFYYSYASDLIMPFGIYFLGVTFDMFDILAFGLGVLIAVFFDKLIFEKFIPHWELNSSIQSE